MTKKRSHGVPEDLEQETVHHVGQRQRRHAMSLQWGSFENGGCIRTPSALLMEEMLFRPSLLGCTNTIQTKCDSVETIESEFGGASRARTDDLLVANEGVTLSASLVISRVCRYSIPHWPVLPIAEH